MDKKVLLNGIFRRKTQADQGRTTRNRFGVVGQGLQWDEVDAAMFRNPGDPFIVVPTPSTQNTGSGASLGNQARSVPDGGTVIIVPKEVWPRK